MPPFRILILSDGRPGHFNLAEGIAAAIERIRPAVTTRVDVRRGRWPGTALAALSRCHLPARPLFARVYGIDIEKLPPCDIVLSAGAETLAASVWLARTRGVANIFYGSLRLFNPHDFSLILTSYQRNATKPRHALALKPSRFDPDSVPRLEAPRPGDPHCIGLLIGGNSSGIRYQDPDWDGLLALVDSYGQSSNVRWLIANSRRTPDDISDRLALQARQPGTPIAQFLDVRTAGAGTLSALLAQCHAVLCTTDSSSMISECIWARKPTLSLAPADLAHTPDEAAYRRWLERSGWCSEIVIAGATSAGLDAKLGTITPLEVNPLEDLANLLRKRLPDLWD